MTQPQYTGWTADAIIDSCISYHNYRVQAEAVAPAVWWLCELDSFVECCVFDLFDEFDFVRDPGQSAQIHASTAGRTREVA